MSMHCFLELLEIGRLRVVNFAGIFSAAAALTLNTPSLTTKKKRRKISFHHVYVFIAAWRSKWGICLSLAKNVK